ncbi:MAG: hypothetical protein IJ863_08665 [Spirochaetales bacterium]|nr:hypothetical protein [Spirochaetales bacterium]
MNELNIQYPRQRRSSLFLYTLRRILKLVCLMALIACPLVNCITGGQAWSVVAVAGTLFFWRTFLSPDIIEFTSIGQVFRLGSFAIIETTLIGVFLSPGWIGFVLPIIAFGTILASAFIFVLNINKRKNNIMPLIWEIILALAAFLAMYIRMPKLNWPTITMGSVAGAFAVLGVAVFHSAIRQELRKRFHTK